VSPVVAGDELRAPAEERQSSKRLARYAIRVTRNEETVALFQGTVYKKDQPWI
jgi:acyl-coenzyme A thioesterase PaaI-like protein